MSRMVRLGCWVLLGGSILCGTVAQGQDKPAAPPSKAKFSVVDPNAADDDFFDQGEYRGAAQFPYSDSGSRGLQVVALGEGAFDAIEYRNGLPGEGGLWADTIKYAGRRDGQFVRLKSENGRRLTLRRGFAVVRDGAGRQLAFFERVQRVSPTMGLQPPVNAVVLFDGSNVDQFIDGAMTEDNLLKMGPLTKNKFGDFYMHVEFRTPYMPYARGQARGNSGVYVQERYEVQVLDSFGLEGAFNECGSLYRTRPPELNMALPPLEWQTYDIYFTAARFNAAGEKTANTRFTVIHNGVSVQTDIELQNKTGAGQKEGPEPRQIRFQNHGDPVVFRNIWMVEGQVSGKPGSVSPSEPALFNFPTSATNLMHYAPPGRKPYWPKPSAVLKRPS